MSMRELTNAHNGYIKERKEDWAVLRRVVYPAVSVHMGKKANTLKLDDILPLDFDDEPKEVKLATVTKHG
jgi:hypothetical protein